MRGGAEWICSSTRRRSCSRIWRAGTPGRVARDAASAGEIAAEFAAAGAPQVVVKAQVKTGGRGKAGGVKLASGPDEAQAAAEAILGLDIKGHIVHKVLVTEASDIAAEYYLSYLLDRSERTFLAICSVEGGMEIEEVAHSNPDAIARIPIDPLAGVDAAKAAEIVRRAGCPPKRPGARPRWRNGSGPCSPARTPPWSR